MGLRTIQVIGAAYSETGNVSVNCQFDGVTVFNDVVSTIATAIPTVRAIGVLFSFTVEDTLNNTLVSSSFTASGGDLIVTGLYADNTNNANLVAFSNVDNNLPGMIKKNITLDGTLLDAVEQEHDWHYIARDTEVLAIDWQLPQLRFDLPGSTALDQRVNAGLFVTGKSYTIRTTGDTNYTEVGSANSAVGTQFVATGAGVGTGVAWQSDKS